MIMTKIADYLTQFSPKYRALHNEHSKIKATLTKQLAENNLLKQELVRYHQLHNLKINELQVTGFTDIEEGDGGKATLVLEGNIPKLGYAAYCYGNALDHRGIAVKLAPFDEVLGGNFFSIQDQKIKFMRSSLTYGSVDGLVWSALQSAVETAMQKNIIH